MASSMLSFVLRCTTTSRKNYSDVLSNFFATTSASKNPESRPPKTGILMLNMGGPATLDQVPQFLHRLFTDSDIMQLPAQQQLGAYIAKRRTPSMTEKYREIGGESPIGKWNEIQGRLLTAILDKICPETAPHKSYIGFRYAPPLTKDALDSIDRDGVKRVVAFSQFPQYSCCTTGSSLNDLFKCCQSRASASKIQWSLIDRWPSHPGFIDAYAAEIKETLKKFPEVVRKDVIILFSAHSLPLKIVNRGDPYPAEVAASALRVMEKLGWSHQYRLVWQSKVGPLPWLGPSTGDAMRGLVERGHKNLLIVPIAFTTDHIETLHELDIEYMKDLAKEIGVENIFRASTPNDNPIFIQGMADLVKNHLLSGEKCSKQFLLRCPKCVNPMCSKTKAFFQINA